MNMNINEASLLTGISKDMIRFYEKKGLIKPKRNPVNNYRCYDEHDHYLLVMIHQYSILGLSLKTIRKLLQNNDRTDAIKELEASIRRLKEEEKWLKAKISSAEDLVQMFQHSTETHSFEIVQHPDMYCYRINENGFGTIMKSIAESRGTARFVCQINIKDALQDPWPDRRALLFSPLPYGITDNLIRIPAQKFLRIVREFPSDHTINSSDIQSILKEIRNNGWLPVDPILIYQVMGDSNGSGMDEVCIEIGIQSTYVHCRTYRPTTSP